MNTIAPLGQKPEDKTNMLQTRKYLREVFFLNMFLKGLDFKNSLLNKSAVVDTSEGNIVLNF